MNAPLILEGGGGGPGGLIDWCIYNTFCESFYQITMLQVCCNKYSEICLATEANFTHDSRCHQNRKIPFTILIDLMHNGIKQCFCGWNVHCGICSHAQIQYGVVLPEVGNLNGRNTDMCSDVAGPSASGSEDLFELSDGSNTTFFV